MTPVSLHDATFCQWSDCHGVRFYIHFVCITKLYVIEVIQSCWKIGVTPWAVQWLKYECSSGKPFPAFPVTELTDKKVTMRLGAVMSNGT